MFIDENDKSLLTLVSSCSGTVPIYWPTQNFVLNPDLQYKPGVSTLDKEKKILLKRFECAVDGHYSPTMQCTKEAYSRGNSELYNNK